MIKNSFELTLAWKKMLTPRVCHLAFSTSQAQPFAFVPGQFITFHIPVEGKILRRSYSIASIHGESDYVEIAAGYIEHGVATELLFNMQVGDHVTTTGPFGRLVLPEQHPGRYVFVATGTGVTPYRAMLPELKQLLHDNPSLEVLLLLGVKTPQELLYGDEFQALATSMPRFCFHPFYSRTQPPEDQPHARHGYVQSDLSEFKLDPETDLVYLCGNPDMIDEAYAKLKNMGFDVHSVKREKYISSGH